MSQSTNDVYPTALKLAAYAGILQLVDAMAYLRAAFEAKAQEFNDVIKMGRTQLQDAVPMTLGQEFSTYAVMLGEDEMRLKEALPLICEINLGATAIGTGINAHPDYARIVCQRLREITGIPVVTAVNLIEATQDCGAFVQLSGVLKRVAVKLSKTCNDLRLLSSGPRVGLGEINLPPMQAGSSIMPGKVNPVIPEVVNQIAFEVIGNDLTVSFAAEAGQLQLNAFEPIIAHSIFKSVNHLRAGCRTLADRCVVGITANREHLRKGVERSIGVVTALNPYIGYVNATEVAREALETGLSVYELVLEKKLLTKDQLDTLLRPRPRAAEGFARADSSCFDGISLHQHDPQWARAGGAGALMASAQRHYRSVRGRSPSHSTGGWRKCAEEFQALNQRVHGRVHALRPSRRTKVTSALKAAFLQRQGCRCAASRQGPERPLCARRSCAARGRSDPGHRAADRCGERRAPVVGALG